MTWLNSTTASEWGSRDSVVDIATGYELDDRGVGVLVLVESRIFSCPQRPDRLWGPSCLLSNGNRGLFLQGQNVKGVKLTTHLQLVPRSRKMGSIHQLPHTPLWSTAYLVKHRNSFTFYCLQMTKFQIKISWEKTQDVLSGQNPSLREDSNSYIKISLLNEGLHFV
jgi:hypothetical protein